MTESTLKTIVYGGLILLVFGAIAAIVEAAPVAVGILAALALGGFILNVRQDQKKMEQLTSIHEENRRIIWQQFYDEEISERERWAKMSAEEERYEEARRKAELPSS